MPDEQQVRIAEAISADGVKPRGQRIGLIPAMLSVVQPEIDELRAENDALLDILADLVDGKVCRLDEQGWCETHSWFFKMPCPHGRARALLKVEEVAGRGE